MLGHTWEFLFCPASGSSNHQPRQIDEVGQSISSWHEVSFNQQSSCLLELALAARTCDRANFKAGVCYWDSISKSHQLFMSFSIKNHFRRVSQTSQKASQASHKVSIDSLEKRRGGMLENRPSKGLSYGNRHFKDQILWFIFRAARRPLTRPDLLALLIMRYKTEVQSESTLQHTHNIKHRGSPAFAWHSKTYSLGSSQDSSALEKGSLQGKLYIWTFSG